jgi:transcriptional regulator with XRE-family HTH domain
MPMGPGTTHFYEATRARLREARKAAGYSQAEMAELLDITQHAYEKYETRSPLPLHLVPKFCLATRITIARLLTGEDEKARHRRLPDPPLRSPIMQKGGRRSSG